MASDIALSPCLSCPYRDMDKNKCALLCLRLAAYNSSEPWEGKPLPYIKKGNQTSGYAEKLRPDKPPGKEEIIMVENEHRTSNIERPTSNGKNEQPEISNEQQAMCVICHNPDKKILNDRSQTCQVCYQRWTRGTILHPTMGKFVPSQIHVKSKIPKPPGTKGSRKPEIGDQWPGMCVICHDPDKKVLNKRSQTCGACYQAWNTGKINHPTLGKFKPSLTKSKIKTSVAKKDQKSETRKGQMSEVGDQKSEVGNQKSEVGNQKSEGIGDHVMSKDSKASYYDAGGIETLDIIKAKLTPEQYKGYLLGCSLKYQCRLMHKFNDKDRIRDAEKAANYSLWLLEAFKN